MWHIAHVGLPVAWDFQTDSPDVVVAVIDDGAMLDHEDLTQSIWTNNDEIPGNGLDDDGNAFEDDVHGWDFFNDDSDPSPDLVPELILGLFPHPTRKEYEAHGTHVGGTIAAVGDNDTGVAGVSWQAQIMPLKFLGGAEGSGTLANAIAAIEYAVANGAHIINASWGGGPESQLLRSAIQTANNAGLLFIAAAGNGGPDGLSDDNDQVPHFPANYDVPNVISVAATTDTDELTDFSNFGHVTVDLAAPGAGILSTVPTGNETSTAPGSGYAEFNGTSMATPIVSGVAALLMARFPDFSHLEVKDLLLRTVDEVDVLAGRLATGGRLNAGSAVGDQPLPAVIAEQMNAVPDEERQQIEENVKALSPATLGRLQMQAPALQNQSTADAQRYDFVVELGTEVGAREIEQRLAPLDIVDQSKVRIPNRNVHEFTIESELPAEQVLDMVRTTPGFEKAEPNFEIKAD
jgi:subtilisin family serine protease